MQKENKIIADNSYRLPVPEGNWKYYQEWHDVLFAHWKYAPELVERILPTGLQPDIYNGDAWISLVAFEVRGMRPHFFPAFSPVSDFFEINMRTYVKRNGRQGIYFLSLEAQKTLSAFMGRTAIGLNYYKSEIVHRDGYFRSVNRKHRYYFRIKYYTRNEEVKRNDLDRWLMERYSLFHEILGKIYRNDIMHDEWELKKIEINSFDLYYNFGDIEMRSPAIMYHFSDGVSVPTWGKKKD